MTTVDDSTNGAMQPAQRSDDGETNPTIRSAALQKRDAIANLIFK
jgi:hypothetical protein